jgi:hypothetical protein
LFAYVRLHTANLVVKTNLQGIRVGLTLLVKWGMAYWLGSGKGITMKGHMRYLELYLMKVIQTKIGKTIPKTTVIFKGHDYQVAISYYS